jgi:hypothetical protein
MKLELDPLNATQILYGELDETHIRGDGRGDRFTPQTLAKRAPMRQRRIGITT